MWLSRSGTFASLPVVDGQRTETPLRFRHAELQARLALARGRLCEAKARFGALANSSARTGQPLAQGRAVLNYCHVLLLLDLVRAQGQAAIAAQPIATVWGNNPDQGMQDFLGGLWDGGFSTSAKASHEAGEVLAGLKAVPICCRSDGCWRWPQT
jgi:hypothetical protein